MGLDMYLVKVSSARKQEVAYWRKANAIHGFFVRECANGIDDCKSIEVTKTVIEKLLSTCERVKLALDSGEQSKKFVQSGVNINKGKVEPVLEEIEVYQGKAATIANELLPPEEGFFFGSYEIDDYYYRCLVKTIVVCRQLLAETDFETEALFYLASW